MCDASKGGLDASLIRIGYIQALRLAPHSGLRWDLKGFGIRLTDFWCLHLSRGNESMYLHRNGPLLENGLDKPEKHYGRYGSATFSSISISTVGLDGARVSLWRFSLLALWVVVADFFSFLLREKLYFPQFDRRKWMATNFKKPGRFFSSFFLFPWLPSNLGFHQNKLNKLIFHLLQKTNCRNQSGLKAMFLFPALIAVESSLSNGPSVELFEHLLGPKLQRPGLRAPLGGGLPIGPNNRQFRTPTPLKFTKPVFPCICYEKGALLNLGFWGLFPYFFLGKLPHAKFSKFSGGGGWGLNVGVTKALNTPPSDGLLLLGHLYGTVRKAKCYKLQCCNR